MAMNTQMDLDDIVGFVVRGFSFYLDKLLELQDSDAIIYLQPTYHLYKSYVDKLLTAENVLPYFRGNLKEQLSFMRKGIEHVGALRFAQGISDAPDQKLIEALEASKPMLNQLILNYEKKKNQ